MVPAVEHPSNAMMIYGNRISLIFKIGLKDKSKISLALLNLRWPIIKHLKQDFKEWDGETENEPNVHELDVRCFRQRIRDADKKRSEGQKRSQIYSHDRLEEKTLEVVGSKGHQAYEESGQVTGQHCAEESSAELNVYLDSIYVRRDRCLVHMGIHHKVLWQINGAQIICVALGQLNKLALVPLQDKCGRAFLSVKGKHSHVVLANKLAGVNSGQGNWILGPFKKVGIMQVAVIPSPVRSISTNAGKGLLVV